ncbi:MAG: DUF2959 family protein [Planctomycetes bacterium]|nr:DUF2959 family protein [Planctomycetota bacterium]
MRIALARSLFVFVPAWLFVASCSSTTEKSQSLRQVDDLLSHVERMQVEVLVGKEKAHAALDQLTALTAPSFGGDPSAAYGQFVHAIDQSEAQARTVSSNVFPMKEAAESMFQQWTVDLESFGNSRLRARSVMRMEETRTRYQNVLSSATAVRVAYEAFNSDLRDHALFLGHDFNTAAVQSIASDVAAMQEQIGEFDTRIEHCVAASKAYVEAGALHGQIEIAPVDPTVAPQAQATAPKPAQPRKRRMTTLAPAQDPVATTITTAPAPAPAATTGDSTSTPKP